MPPSNKSFEHNVFINCPFDREYYSLLRPLLFTITYLGFNPRIALESSDSGEMRIEKICALIKSSKYSIHDLSRLKAAKKGEFYRLNMPFELGARGRHFFRTGFLVRVIGFVSVYAPSLTVGLLPRVFI